MMIMNALQVLSHLRHKCLPLWKHKMSPESLHYEVFYDFSGEDASTHPLSPVLESELVSQKFSTVWGRRFVAVFSLHSLPSAGSNSFSVPSPEGPVHQYRPWHRHLPVQCGLDWGWQGLCAHRQLHAGEQRELPPQCWLCLHRAWTGMSRAEQPAGRNNTPSAALRWPWAARGKNWAGQQPNLLVHCQKHQLQPQQHSALACEVHWCAQDCCSTLGLVQQRDRTALCNTAWPKAAAAACPCPRPQHWGACKLFRQSVQGAGPRAMPREEEEGANEKRLLRVLLPPWAWGALHKVLRKGTKTVADFSEVKYVSALLDIFKAGSFEINSSFCHSQSLCHSLKTWK